MDMYICDHMTPHDTTWHHMECKLFMLITNRQLDVWQLVHIDNFDENIPDAPYIAWATFCCARDFYRAGVGDRSHIMINLYRIWVWDIAAFVSYTLTLYLKYDTLVNIDLI